MALAKEIELPNGVTVAYHRVVRTEVVTNVQTAVEVASYASAEARRREKEALAAGEPCDVYVATSVYAEPVDPGSIDAYGSAPTTPAGAYGWLKRNISAFEGATDLLED